MYIHEFTVKNFLCHKDTTVCLSPITVFVGPNGGGKSAFFDAILNFSMVARGNIKQAFGPYPFSFSATKYHGAHRIEEIGFEVVMSRRAADERKLSYKIDYSQQGPAESGTPNFIISAERLTRMPEVHVIFDRSNPRSSPLRKATDYLERDRGIFAALRSASVGNQVEPDEARFVEAAREISKFNKFRLDPYVLAQPSRLPDLSEASESSPRLGYQGEDLAACLYYLKETKNTTLDVVIRKIQRLIPEFQSFDFTFLGPDRVAFMLVFSDARGEVPAVRASHGLLLYVGLIVLACSPNRPPVMLIEEPENGLTPSAVSEFYTAVRELAFREDDMHRSQVLISSHSPFVICEAWNGEDREFIHQVKVVNGFSVVRKFSEVTRESGAKLRSGPKPNTLGLRTAELLMAGYLF